MKTLPYPRAVIFDMDGVLIDSMPAHIYAWQEAWLSVSIPVSPHEIAELAGVSTEDTVRILCQRYRHPFSPDLLSTIRRRKGLYKKRKSADKPFPAIYPLLSLLQARKIMMAIVSGSSHSHIQQICDRYFRGFFATHIGQDDTKKGKPDSLPYRVCLRQLRRYRPRLQPNECIVIEDGINGLNGACKIGMFTIGIGSTLQKDRIEPHCDLYISNHHALLRHFRERFKTER